MVAFIYNFGEIVRESSQDGIICIMQMDGARIGSDWESRWTEAAEAG